MIALNVVLLDENGEKVEKDLNELMQKLTAGYKIKKSFPWQQQVMYSNQYDGEKKAGKVGILFILK